MLGENEEKNSKKEKKYIEIGNYQAVRSDMARKASGENDTPQQVILLGCCLLINCIKE